MQPQMCPAEPNSCFASLVRGSRTDQAAWQEEMIHSLPKWMRAAKSLLMVCDLGSWQCLLLTRVTLGLEFQCQLSQSKSWIAEEEKHSRLVMEGPPISSQCRWPWALFFHMSWSENVQKCGQPHVPKAKVPALLFEFRRLLMFFYCICTLHCFYLLICMWCIYSLRLLIYF